MSAPLMSADCQFLGAHRGLAKRDMSCAHVGGLATGSQSGRLISQVSGGQCSRSRISPRRARRPRVGGQTPVHTHDLVVSLRDFIRRALDLDPIPADLAIPMRGPARPSNSARRGKGEGGKESRRGGEKVGGMGMGAGIGMGGGMGAGSESGGIEDNSASEHSS